MQTGLSKLYLLNKIMAGAQSVEQPVCYNYVNSVILNSQCEFLKIKSAQNIASQEISRVLQRNALSLSLSLSLYIYIYI